ncbi:MAG: type IV pilin N-terminal domain-containing protein [Candidatus Aenigmarchaeota archaeon]|nr:type IV pilin N-terminal domain-containing protein [Candidatus Aenigmarchaeota archaeon]
MTNLKGVSPLIAVIMLIALTLIIAGILATFTQNIATRTISGSQRCQDAKVIIQGATYTASNNNLTLVVYNYGSIDLNFTTLLSYQNGSIIQGPYIPTTAGDIVTTIVDAFSNLDEVTIKSVECSGTIQDLLPRTFIRGLGA